MGKEPFQTLLSQHIMHTNDSLFFQIMLYLANRPEMQERIRKEMAKACPDMKTKIPNNSARSEMPFTEAFIHESQRLGNVVSLGLFRASSMDVSFRGHFIPKDTQIIPFLGEVSHEKQRKCF